MGVQTVLATVDVKAEYYAGGGAFSKERSEDYASGSLETEFDVLKTKLKELLTRYEIEWRSELSSFHFMKNITTL